MMARQDSMLEVQIDGLGEVAAMLGYLPGAVAAALSEHVYDMLSHHRTSVIKHGAENFNSPARARRFLASRLFRYSRKKPLVEQIEDVQGESFMAGRSQPGQYKDGRTFPLDDEFLELLEFGGNVNTNEPMAIPIAAGVNQSGPYRGQGTRHFYKALKEGKLDVVDRPGQVPLLVQEHEGARRREGIHGARTSIMGVLVRRRRQRPMLEFFAQFERIRPRHQAKIDKTIEQAETAAGREAIAKRQLALKAGRSAYEQTLKKLVEAHPGNHAGARKAAADAARQARRIAMAGGLG